MADFEELKLTVTLVDDASTGLASIRTQLTQLTQTAGQVQTAFAGVSSSAQQVGHAAQQAAPRISSAEKALKELKGSAEETTRGMLQMGLAARRGMEAFPEMALGLREATQGLKGVSTGLSELAPASRVAVLSIGAVAVGVTAVTAAVVGFGITVFRFAREMSLINDTAKTLGTSFADLKNAIDIAEKFDVAAETVIRNFNGIAAAQANLSQNNSSSRHRLLGMGVDANFLNQVQNQDDPVKAQNLIADRARLIQRTLIEQRGWTKAAARAQANQFLGEFGQDPGSIDRPNQKEMTKEQRETYESIGKQSEKISEVWNEVYHDVKMIGFEIANWGMPLVLSTLQVIKRVFDEIGNVVKSIKDAFATVESWIPDWLKNVFRGMANGPGGTGGAGAVGNALRGMMNGPNGPSGSGGASGGWGGGGGGGGAAPGGATGSWAPSSYQGGGAANDNSSLLQRTSLTSGGGPNAAGSAGLPGGAAVQGQNRYTGEATVAGAQAPRGGGRPGYNYFQHRGDAAIRDPSRLATVNTAFGPVKVHPEAAEDFKKTADALAEAGAPIKKFGSYNYREKRWGGGMSSHAYGAAFDVDDAASLSPQMKQWIQANPDKWRSALSAGNFGQPLTDQAMTGGKDAPHIEWRGPRAGESTAAGVDQGIAAGSRVAGIQGGGAEYLRQQRAPLTAQLANDPGLKRQLASLVTLEHESDPTAVVESLYNRTTALNEKRAKEGKPPLSLHQMMYGGFYGPAGQIPGRLSQLERDPARMNAMMKGIDAASTSNLLRGATDQGSGTDPNVYWPGGKIIRDGETYNDWGGGAGHEGNRIFRERQQAQIAAADRAALDRSALSKPTEINSTGKLDVAVSAPAGTKVKYHGQNLLKQTSMQRSTAMQETKSGPSVADTAQQYMAGN